MARLHNVTFYVGPDEFDDVRTFYAERLGLPVVFEEPGHICCFDVGTDLAICVHEAEPGHPAGARELFLWADEPTVLPKYTSPIPSGTACGSTNAGDGLDPSERPRFRPGRGTRRR